MVKFSCTKQLPQFDAAAICLPLRTYSKAWTVLGPQQRPFQKTPLKAPFTVMNTECRIVLMAGSGPLLLQQTFVPIRACSWSLKDYVYVCAGEVTCIHRARCHYPGQRSGVSGLFLSSPVVSSYKRHEILEFLLSSLWKGSHLMGKMFLPAIKQQQGTASQVRF